MKKLGQKIFRPKSCVIFSGSEIGRLMGFPIDADVSANGEIILNVGHESVFRFPETCSIRCQWKLLGNSFNVRVAACAAELGLEIRPSSRR